MTSPERVGLKGADLAGGPPTILETARLWLYAVASEGYRLLMAVSICISSAKMTPLWLAVAPCSADRGLLLVCQSVTGPLYVWPRLRAFMPTDTTFRGDSI